MKEKILIERKLGDELKTNIGKHIASGIEYCSRILPRLSKYSSMIMKRKKTINSHRRQAGYDGICKPYDGVLKMVSDAFYIPKGNSLKSKGEDAYFICAEKQTMAVADGVGGWIKHGVDAGKYARQLILQSLIAVQKQPDGAVDPREVLNEAYENTDFEGSSTACIVTLKDGALHVVNVGDSGFMVFRSNKLLYQSPPQQHCFNRPYQLGRAADRPDSACEIKIGVEARDIVVLGTDGLLDNVFPSEIEEVIVGETTKQGLVRPNRLASIIADLALRNSRDRNCDSPYARAAQLVGKKRVGGKRDDITVVVGLICE